MFKEQLLPNLNNNIVCGNSLIGTDILESNLFNSVETRHASSLQEVDELKLKPMNFEDAFPEVMRKGGFDAIVGNPPYGAKLCDTTLSYFKQNYKSFSLGGESYILFTEKALNQLKTRGMLGYIIPDTYLNLGFTKSLRDFLLTNSSLKEIVILPNNIFTKAVVDTTLLITQKESPIDNYHQSSVTIKQFNKRMKINLLENPEREFTIPTELWYQQDNFNVRLDSNKAKLLDVIDNHALKINSIAEMYSGVKASEVGKGTPPQTAKVRDEKPFTSLRREDENWSPLYDGKHIGRYQILWSNNNWIKYGKWIAAPREPKNFIGEKILLRKIVGKTLIATYVNDTSYCNTLLFILKLEKDSTFSYKSLLAILNSKLIGWYYINKFQISSEDTFPQIMIRDILQFPLPLLTEQSKMKIENLVTQIIESKKSMQDAKTENEKEYLEKKCSIINRQIDALVYELYGLTEEEIKIIEGK